MEELVILNLSTEAHDNNMARASTASELLQMVYQKPFDNICKSIYCVNKYIDWIFKMCLRQEESRLGKTVIPSVFYLPEKFNLALIISSPGWSDWDDVNIHPLWKHFPDLLLQCQEDLSSCQTRPTPPFEQFHSLTHAHNFGWPQKVLSFLGWPSKEKFQCGEKPDNQPGSFTIHKASKL